MSCAQKVFVRIICPDPERLISAAVNNEIVLTEINLINGISLTCFVNATQLRKLKSIIIDCCGEMRIIHWSSNYYIINSFRSRWAIVLTLSLLLVLTLWLPTHVLFVNVVGNSKISTNSILEKAEQCGVVFGVSRRLVRSEAVKNKLLSEMPQLQWVGVNTTGCVAEIAVEERNELQTEQDISEVSSIVAACDGIIQEITVHRGTQLCQPGQAVRKGQVLVSGYTDCGIVIRAEEAAAEITAQTKHTVTAVTPVTYLNRSEESGVRIRCSIQIGKKTIKLFKDSGISDPKCVRIYKMYPLILPGDFVLPVSLSIEQIWYADYCDNLEPQSESWNWLQNISDNYLNTQMLSGRILEASYTQFAEEGFCTQHAVYDCVEVIGRVRIEEVASPNGKGN